MKKTIYLIYKKWLLPAFDFSLFLVIFIVIAPFLFVSGGFRRITRYFWYVKRVGNKETPKTYYW